MAGDINDYALVNISASLATVTQKGFGLPLIVSHTAAWTERVREYTTMAGVEADFAANTAERLAAAKIFGQNPRPPKLLIGRASGFKPTAQFEYTPVVLNNYVYRFEANGTVVSFTSDGSATASEITAGLKAAFDLLGLAMTSSQQGAGATLRLLANTPGAFFRIKCLDRTNLPMVQNHVDPGVATDLAAIALERNDWFAIHTAFNSKAYVEAVASYANSNKKLYVYQTSDSVVPQTPNSGTDDVGESLKSLGNDYSAGVYSDGVADFVDAGAYGARLPKKPGRATWMFAQLADVPAGTYTPTERANMKAKNIGWYEETAGVKILNEGKLASGRFIDFRIHIDSVTSRMKERIYAAQVVNDKVSFDDAGITIVKGCVESVLEEDTLGEKAPIDKSSVVVTAPLASAVSAQDRTDRSLTGVNFTYRYTGAIHKATVDGVATL